MQPNYFPPLPPSPEQIAEHRAEIERANEMRRRIRVAAENRKAGRPAPEPGMILYLTTQRGIKRRGRAGLLFSDAAPLEVKVISASDDEIATRQAANEAVVNLVGAEDLLADTGRNGGLMLHGVPIAIAVAQAKEAAAAEIAAERERADELAKQLESLQRQLAAAKKGESDGRPERLGKDKDKDEKKS